jgi:hypothetical protein
MTATEFKSLSIELNKISLQIPLKWGDIQNDRTDVNIDMFRVNSLSDLEITIANLSDQQKNYFRRRWFLWKCAQCDEYLFLLNSNVRANPNPKDQEYDVEFIGDEKLRFDIKGTVIPNRYKDSIAYIFKNPGVLVDFFYNQQSRGVRNHFQNRIFLVHHSFVCPQNEMGLRCNWEFKKLVYKEYSSRVNGTSKFIDFKGVKADVIFLIENWDGSLSKRFVSV